MQTPNANSAQHGRFESQYISSLKFHLCDTLMSIKIYGTLILHKISQLQLHWSIYKYNFQCGMKYLWYLFIIISLALSAILNWFFTSPSQCTPALPSLQQTCAILMYWDWVMCLHNAFIRNSKNHQYIPINIVYVCI